jgi:rieske iron-sulfur protein
VRREDERPAPALVAVTAAGPTAAPASEDELMRSRRSIIQAGVGVGVALTVGGLSVLSVSSSLRPPPQVTPDREPPMDGDELVLASDKAHQLTLADIPLASGVTLAYPRNPISQVVKSGTVLNLVVLSRFDAAELQEGTRPFAADGVVAYSGVCPHLGCTVTSWEAEPGWLHCVCHHAYFDPRNGAEVMTGISPRPLPALPLKVIGGNLFIAGGFLSPVGVA